MKTYTFIIGSADDFESLDHLIDYVEANKEKGFQDYSTFEFETDASREEDVTMIGRGHAFSNDWSMDDTFSFMIQGELDPECYDQYDNRVNEALRMRM